MLTSELRVRLLERFDDYPLRVWQRLCISGPSPAVFLTRAWQRTWWKVFGRGNLLLISVERDAEPIALAPLFCEAGMVFFVGAGCSDYLDLVGDAGEPEVLDLLLATARECTPGFVGFRLHHIPDASPTGLRLANVAERLGMKCYDEGDLAAPILRFADWPAEALAPEEKKSLRRHERFFVREGTLEVEHCRTAESIEPHLEAFFKQHIHRWSNTEYPSLFLDGRQRQFYRELVRDQESAEWLRFTRISWQNRPIAYHFGSCFQKVFLWYKPSFDIGLARHSPGEVLLRQLLVAAREEGAEIFDMGIGDESFKHRFATKSNRVRTWGLYPRVTALMKNDKS